MTYISKSFCKNILKNSLGKKKSVANQASESKNKTFYTPQCQINEGLNGFLASCHSLPECL